MIEFIFESQINFKKKEKKEEIIEISFFSLVRILLHIKNSKTKYSYYKNKILINEG
jgi:hypothetical protein